ncbi:MAG: PQQ-binding-like beta-propeller repeat protein [Thermoguttaceae bacterium]
MDGRRGALRASALGWVAWLVWIGPAAQPLAAQLFRPRLVQPPGTSADGDEPVAAENTFAVPDRATLQQLNRAREAIGQGRYGEALEGLGDILRGGEDYFFQPDRKKPIYRGLKAEARQLIGWMPREGRDLYEIRAGADARAMFQRSLGTGDSSGLAQVSGRYFHTQGGYEATFLLGLWHLDHGSPLAALLTLKRLLDVPEAGDRFEPALSLAAANGALQAGMPKEAAGILVALRQRHPRLALSIGGQPVGWFASEAEAADWLGRLAGTPRAEPAVQSERWTMFRGDPARNAATAGGAPLLSMKWRVPVTDDDAGADGPLQQLQQRYRRHGVVLIPSIHPLVVGDLVLTRTVRKLLAVDFATEGSRKWDVPADDPTEKLEARNQVDPFGQGNPVPMRWAALGQRIWDDAAYGTLSSDGRLVFSLEDLGSGVRSYPHMGVVVFNAAGNRSDAAAHGPSNRLAAHDIRTGKLKWELGGASGSLSLRQNGTFFLGAPLPLREQLYVLAEVRDEIRLMALEAATGDLLWSQQLTMVEQGVSQDVLRRLAGVSPSYANGILVCPTGANSVVAVDLATRELLWGYRYPHAPGPVDPNRQQMLFQVRNTPGMPLVPRWLDSAATVVEGRVLLTPPETDALFCLNLADGQPAWPPVPRQDDLYLACVHRGAAVLAGTGHVRAIRLADGKPAWDGRKIALADGARPSGRGFYSGNRYFLPTSSAEVVAIDLDRGAVAQVVKSRKGYVPGNLVCYRGWILSQGLDGLEAFYQADVAREEIRQRLAVNPDDAKALSLRGEVLLEEGKREEAVAQFRRAYEADRDGDLGLQARELLRDALLEGLREQFAAYSKQAAEIEPLLDAAGQRAEFLRLMAAGFRRQGDWSRAIAHCLKLADLDTAAWPVERVERSLRVRRDCWIRAELAAIRREGPPAAKAEIDRALEPRLRAALAAEGLLPLRRFVQCFGDPRAGAPAAGAEARRELVRRLAKADGLLEAEMLLLAEHPQEDRAASAAALVELAELFRLAGRPIAAEAACYRSLAERYGDVVCRDGKTGRQWVSELPADAPVRSELRPPSAWPAGEVEVKPGRAADARGLVFGRFGMPLDPDSGPFFADTSLRFGQDQNRQMVSGTNGLGQTCWEVPLTEDNHHTRFAINSYNPNYLARTQGHLLLVAMGTRIFALDPLGVSGAAHKVLWSEDLTDPGDAGELNAWGAFPVQQFSFNMTPLGPVTSRYVAFVRFSSLEVVDPVTGQTLWVREDLPAGCEVFGDEQYIFVLLPWRPATPNPYAYSAPAYSATAELPQRREAMVLRALDGQLLGKRTVPFPKNGDPFGGVRPDRNVRNVFQETGMATIGRYVLLWDTEPTGAELTLLDPWQETAAAERRWSRTFTAGARASLVGGEAVGVLQPDGHFVLLGLPDGRTIADTNLQLQPPPVPAPVAPVKVLGRPNQPEPAPPLLPAVAPVPVPAQAPLLPAIGPAPVPAQAPLLPGIAPVPVRVQPTLAALTVLHLGDQYFVVAHETRRAPRRSNNQSIQALQGMLYQAVDYGRLFALDEQGKPQWPAPVTIEGQHLLLSQPARLPALILGSQKHERRANGPVQTWTAKTWVQVIDRRTGRIVYDRETDNPSMVFDVVGNADQKTVELRMYGGGRPPSGSVVLTFTDKPITAKLPPRKPPGRITDALQHALEQAVPIRIPGSDEEDEQ